MKIWIDIRNSSKTKKVFCKDFLDFFQSHNSEHTLRIYADSLFDTEHKISNEKFGSFFGEQTFFLQQLLKDKNDVVISFDETFPVLYHGKVIQVIPTLENILYPDVENTKLFKKYSYLFTIKKNLKHAEKIVCFSENSKRELNEKLNISEEKIMVLKPFFPSSPENTTKIDIKTNLWITWDYFIYDYNYYTNNNLKRVLESIKELSKTREIFLVILGNKNANNREIRELILELSISNKIFFVWTPDSKELGAYYTQSRGVLYPIIYDNFPMSLNHAVNYQVPILASENSETRNIFGDEITYFSPISVSSMVKNIDWFLEKNIQTTNYKNIKKNYNQENFYTHLISIL